MPRSDGSEVSLGQVFELRASLDRILPKAFFSFKKGSNHLSSEDKKPTFPSPIPLTILKV